MLEGALQVRSKDVVVGEPALTAVGVSGTVGPLPVVTDEEDDENEP